MEIRGPAALLWLTAVPCWCFHDAPSAFTVSPNAGRSAAFANRDGHKRGIPIRFPLQAASAPYFPVPVSSDDRPQANGVSLKDGTYRRYGWLPRDWRETVLIFFNAALLTLLRRRFLPTQSVKSPNSQALKVALGLFLGAAEYLIYLLPLLQLHLDIFKRPSLLSAESLAVDLSVFHPVGPLQVHALHTLPPSKRVHRIVHFNHGFGASSFSFTPVLHRLARSLEAATIAHDCPGFGLTSEPPATPQGDALYSFEHNAVLGQALVEAEVLKMGGLPHKGMVYAGHSMGGITSSYQALQHVYGHEGNATSAAADGQPPTVLVLIAPALIAMNAPLKPTTKGKSLIRTPGVFRWVWGLGLRRASLSLLRFVLRSVVYVDSFWANGLGQAWGPIKKPCVDTIVRYRRPSLKTGWDRSLARFVLAPVSGLMMPPAGDESGRRRRAVGEVIAALAEGSKEGKLKVLIIHGKQDAVIPIGNSRKLHQLIPGSQLIEMDNTGHVPHEEHPEDFAQFVEQFLKEEV